MASNAQKIELSASFNDDTNAWAKDVGADQARDANSSRSANVTAEHDPQVCPGGDEFGDKLNMGSFLRCALCNARSNHRA